MLKYPQALRAIGQDLENHGAVAFEINANENEYVVQCDCDLPPPGNLLFFCYTEKIIKQIDFMGKLKRTSGGHAVGGAETLGTILRSLGAYVEKKRGRLLRVANYESPGIEPAFRVEFAKSDGSHFVDDISKSSLDDIDVALRSKRSDEFPR